MVGSALIDRMVEWSRSDRNPTAAASGEKSAAYYAPGNAERPGHFPFSRGITEQLYQDELWVMGMYSGYSSPKETNERFRKLLSAGQTGLSIALDLPTQIGVDSDDPVAFGEVGKVGVPINTVEDMLALLDGLPLDKIRQIRSTANAISPIMAAFTVVALDELGIDPGSFRLFLQNDPLKEFPARGTWIFPPAESLRFSVDVIEYFSRHHPQWQPIQFCGYHIRDAGGSAVQEVAVSAANGIAYLDEAARRGVDIAEVAPQLFLFLSASLNIFEEVAKFRAARRFWARLLTDNYGVPPERAAIKIFSYTLGGALVAQEPLNNITRIAYEALAAVLGGVQTLATSSWDEAHSLPTEEAALLSLRTQQILAHETGVPGVVDPLGGSHYVEALTDKLFGEIAGYTAQILQRGGAVAAIESGFVANELGDAAYRQFLDVSEKRRLVVGVNCFNSSAGEGGGVSAPSIPAASDGAAKDAIRRLNLVRAQRVPHGVAVALDNVTAAARSGANTIPALIEAARSRASIGEMTDSLAKVWGRFQPNVEYGEPVPQLTE